MIDNGNLLEPQQSRNPSLEFFVREHMTINFRSCILAMVLLLAIGTFSYSLLMSEQWSMLDSLYFSMVTLSTVGYGDLYPTTALAQIFTIVFSILGVSVFGVVLGVIGSRVVENQMKHNYIHSLQHGNIFRIGLNIYAPLFIVVLTASAIVAYMEQWGFVQAVYFCTVTASGIGYGDIVPTTVNMRLLAVFFIPLLVGAMTHFLASVVTFIMDVQREALIRDMYDRRLHQNDIKAIDLNGDEKVSELEYVLFMLIKMHGVHKDLLEQLKGQYRNFDVNRRGHLSKSDVSMVAL